MEYLNKRGRVVTVCPQSPQMNRNCMHQSCIYGAHVGISAQLAPAAVILCWSIVCKKRRIQNASRLDEELIGDCIAYHHEREYFLLIRFMGLEKAGKGVAAARGVAHGVTDMAVHQDQMARCSSGSRHQHRRRFIGFGPAPRCILTTPSIDWSDFMVELVKYLNYPWKLTARFNRYFPDTL
jgi:hypothetical protein